MAGMQSIASMQSIAGIGCDNPQSMSENYFRQAVCHTPGILDRV